MYGNTDGRKIDEIANAGREGGKGGAEEIGIRSDGKGQVRGALSTPNWKERVQQCRAIWGEGAAEHASDLPDVQMYLRVVESKALGEKVGRMRKWGDAEICCGGSFGRAGFGVYRTSPR